MFCSLREQLGNSRTLSGPVVRCRCVFAGPTPYSPKQNPAYAPLSAHNPRFEFGFESYLSVERNKQGTAHRKKAGAERDLQCPRRLRGEFAPLVDSTLNSSDCVEHSSATFCVVLALHCTRRQRLEQGS